MIFDRGADRGQLNQFILALRRFQAPVCGHRHPERGPRPAEQHRPVGRRGDPGLARWPLGDCRGALRLTRFGPMFPSGGMGPGFDNMLNGYVWRLCAERHPVRHHVQPRHASSSSARPNPIPLSLQISSTATCSTDFWGPWPADNFAHDRRGQLGTRHPQRSEQPLQLGTPLPAFHACGLVVGADNPFSPQSSIRGLAGSRYVDCPQGGLEIWLGSPETRWAGQPRRLGRAGRKASLAGARRFDARGAVAARGGGDRGSEVRDRRSAIRRPTFDFAERRNDVDWPERHGRQCLGG